MHWRPAPAVVAAVSCAGLLVAAALLFAQPRLVVFAAPMFASAWASTSRGTARVRAWITDAEAVETTVVRCVEGEPVEVHVHVETTDGAVLRRRYIPAVDGIESPVYPDEESRSVRLTPRMWGRYPVPVQVELSDRTGLSRGTAVLRPLILQVLPAIDEQPVTAAGGASLNRVGSHPTARAGTGSEYADIRPFAPGDSVRLINWRATARRGSVLVTARAPEHAHDIVLMIEDPVVTGGQPSTAADRAVRATALLARAALRSGDRVGLICLGSRPRWLAVGAERHQFVGLMSTLLDPDVPAADTFPGTVVPRHAVPPAATVVALSTLAETRFVATVSELRKRGHRTVVVDVSDDTAAGAEDPVVERVRRLERSGLYRDLRAVGIEVFPWPGERLVPEVLGSDPADTVVDGRFR